MPSAGEPLRCAIPRKMMASGERMMVVITGRVGRPASMVSKRLAVVRGAGTVGIHQRLQYIRPEFLPEPGSQTVDLGACVLRLGGGKE